MAPRNLFERVVESGVGSLGEPSTLEQLIGDAVKGRNHADDWLAFPRVEQNPGDLADRRRCGQR